jgi:hypothetical protein
MIVVVIILILLGILVPVVNGALRRARVAQVKTEISGLQYAITDFKNNFGIAPPSYIDFTRDGGGALPTKTQSILRRLWPQIDLSLVPAGFNRVYSGGECLVFFLGGVGPQAGFDTDGDGVVDNPPRGFSANPRNPFAAPSPSATDKRVGPFFEFKPNRLVLGGASGKEVVGYRDPLPGQTQPYFYITPDQYAAQVTRNSTAAAAAIRPVYQQGTSAFFNQQSFQIISPGYDGVTGENNALPGGPYGAGGIYNASKGTITDMLPAGPLKGTALGDRDNITNFNDGVLVP